jgi:hypothetical protein
MEVVMKTTIKIIATALIASLLGACSSSMQLSRSSSHQEDDLYYTSKSSRSTETNNQEHQTSSSLKLAELEKKYTEILANDSIGSIDTTIYNDPYVNPYDRILADTYEEAYQRRLDARMDPYYGMNNWTARYSNDYWYASAYDPYFYNVVVVGSSIWVEPNYISSGFGWPYFGSRYYRPYYSFGLGFHSPSYGWYSPWNYPVYNHWSYGWYNPWSTYGVYNAGFYDGYNWGNKPNYNYGRRPGTGTVNYDRVVAGSESVTAGVNSTRRDMASKQATFGNETARDRVSSSKNQGSATITQPGEIVGDLRSDNRRIGKPGTALGNPQDPDTKTRVAGDRQGKTTRVAEPVRDKNNNIVSRPSRESANANLTRISTRNSSRTGERTHTPSYTRPNPGNNTKFNTPSSRNYPASQGVSNRAGQSVGGAVRSPRQPSPSYTPPPRSSSPTINRGNSNTRGTSNSGYSGSRGSSSVGSSKSSGSSSVGSSSSGSSSKGTSSTGSSSTSTRRR